MTTQLELEARYAGVVSAKAAAFVYADHVASLCAHSGVMGSGDVLIDMIGGAGLRVEDVRSVAADVHDAGGRLFADITVPSHFGCHAFDLGADVQLEAVQNEAAPAEDFIPAESADRIPNSVWDRIRAGFAVPNLNSAPSTAGQPITARIRPICCAWRIVRASTSTTLLRKSRHATCRRSSRCCPSSKAPFSRKRSRAQSRRSLAVHAGNRQRLRARTESLAR